jgi:hypothetical protein
VSVCPSCGHRNQPAYGAEISRTSAPPGHSGDGPEDHR